jgi:hypothetical protein
VDPLGDVRARYRVLKAPHELQREVGVLEPVDPPVTMRFPISDVTDQQMGGQIALVPTVGAPHLLTVGSRVIAERERDGEVGREPLLVN